MQTAMITVITKQPAVRAALSRAMVTERWPCRSDRLRTRVTPGNFRAAFTAAEGWGLFSQRRDGGVQDASLELRWGRLDLNQLRLQVPKDRTVEQCNALVGELATAVSFRQDNDRITITLREAAATDGRLWAPHSTHLNLQALMAKRPLITGWIMAISWATVSTLAGGRELATDEKTFGEDAEFLARHVEVVVLGDDGGPQVAVVPAYQGRVMTSTATGRDGFSYGWINYDQVAAGISPAAQINVFGGEERFWLGPEGGQFSIFFPPGAEFVFANWQTPPLLDTVSFQVVNRNSRQVAFRHDASLQNRSGTRFDLRIDRSVELMDVADIGASLKLALSAVSTVGYRTVNRLTNRGSNNWTEESGLLSIWLLGMYKHGPQTTIVIPFRQGPESELGPVVNDAYFGQVPADRLRIDNGLIFFSGDGQQRGKIGLSPQRATPLCGSYDAARHVLTIVKYNQPATEVTSYVNSMWEIQDQPYAGDAVNAYNDGAPEPGAKPLGPFYELETSSPALALRAGQSAEHLQETIHFEGAPELLNEISKSLLGVTLEQIQAALP
jgi:hypothetical protein